MTILRNTPHRRGLIFSSVTFVTSFVTPLSDKTIRSRMRPPRVLSLLSCTPTPGVIQVWAGTKVTKVTKLYNTNIFRYLYLYFCHEFCHRLVTKLTSLLPSYSLPPTGASMTPTPHGTTQ